MYKAVFRLSLLVSIAPDIALPTKNICAHCRGEAMSSPGQDRNCHDIKAIRIQYNPINNKLFCNTVLRCYRAKTQLRPYKAYAIFRHNTISVDLLTKVYNLNSYLF